MNNKILKTVNKYCMLQKGESVLAAVSGGADSMLLLHFLLCVQKEFDLHISVAHVEHGIRGEDSLNDAKFVRSFCGEHKIQYYEKRLDVQKQAKEAGVGVEEFARNARYDFFQSIECDKIATAHNLSDNVETVLFRLSRGTGLKGMCGIPSVRGKIIRPLIEVTGDEIRQYCDENNVLYRIDKTNLSNEYTRNYIRNQVVPDFQKLNPSFEQAVSRFISSCVNDEFYLDLLAREHYNKAIKEDALVQDEILNLPSALLRRVLMIYSEFIGVALDEKHLCELEVIAKSHGKVQIKKNVFAICINGLFSIVSSLDKLEKLNNTYSKRIQEITEFLNIRELYKEKIAFYCDYDKIVGNVQFRARKEGDRISPAGRNCSKSLKKLFNEKKIPLEQRELDIVITDDNSIIGVLDCCCSEHVMVDDTTKNIYFVLTDTEDIK